MQVSDIEDHLRTPESRRLLAAWREASQSGGIPPVRLLDSSFMRDLGRDLCLVERNEHGEFEYLFFGEALKRLTGTDLTGKSTAHQSPKSGGLARRNFQQALDLLAPVFVIDREADNGRVHLWGRLFLPLAEADKRIVIACYNRPREYTDELLREVLDAAADGIIAIKAQRDGEGRVIDGTVLAANTHMLEILRLEHDAVMVTPISKLFPDEHANGTWARHIEVLESRQCQSFESRHDTGGATRWYRVVSAPMGDGLVVSFSDITELKLLNLALEEKSRLLTEEMVQRSLIEQELWDLAHLDPLTNVANRRSMQERALAAVKLARKTDVPCTMIVIDIDFFKRINDSWGHAAGDRAIQSVAEVARACCRGERDVIARMGGEEFALLLYGTRVCEGITIAERLRRQIEQIKLIEGENNFTLTVSCGVAELRPDATYEEWLAEADNALYAAKREGRNRTNGAPETAAA